MSVVPAVVWPRMLLPVVLDVLVSVAVSVYWKVPLDCWPFWVSVVVVVSFVVAVKAPVMLLPLPLLVLLSWVV